MSAKLYLLTIVLLTGGAILGLALAHAISMDEVNGLIGLWLGHVFTVAGGVARNGNATP